MHSVGFSTYSYQFMVRALVVGIISFTLFAAMFVPHALLAEGDAEGPEAPPPPPPAETTNGDSGDSGDSGSTPAEEPAPPSPEPGDDGTTTEGGTEGGDDGGDAGEDGGTPEPAPEEGDGTEGDEGNEGGEGNPNGEGTGGEAVVVTGDAESVADVNNDANANETNQNNDDVTEDSSETTEDGEGEETTTEEGSSSETETDTEGNVISSHESGETTFEQNEDGITETEKTESTETVETEEGTKTTHETHESETVLTPVEHAGGNTDITAENDGDLANDAEVGANTGSNDAIGGDGALIDTGDAFSAANIVNVVNTNIVNSFGSLVFLNWLFGGTVDFTNYFDLFDFSDKGPSTSCVLFGCGNEDAQYNVAATNTAQITNNVVVRSSTGNNYASSTDGTAAILTGDAYAGANIVNVANTNIVDSQYLLIGLNNFGDQNGDIILPGANFFSQLLASNAALGSGGGDLTVENDNTAAINNNVQNVADTGNNEATSEDGQSGIITGDADAGTNVSNTVNSNFTGGTTVYLMFRIYGDWTGDVFGLPEGVSWSETDEGVQIYSEGSGGGLPLSSANTTVTNTNDATITNNVDVLALTGNNKAEGADGAGIITGDAVAGVNIINVANTNVVGQNWIFAIFNILGDFKGNIAFGQPDLWLGAQAGAQGSDIGPGSGVDYTFTITNFGNAIASDVWLELSYNKALMNFADQYEPTEDGGGIKIPIGALGAGETIDVQFPAFVTTNLPYGSTQLPLTAQVHGLEPDGDTNDNTEEIMLVAVNAGAGISGTQVNYTPDSNLVISKESSVSALTAPSSVDYTITIKNEGAGPAYHAELFDTLSDEAGNIINQETWWLGEIPAGEEIMVTYTTEFATSSPAGIYTNAAQVKAITRHASIDPFYGTFGHSEEVSSEVVVSAYEAPVELAPEPEVHQCEPYITTYIGRDLENDRDDVRRLQDFLREIENFTGVPTTGIYDSITFDAVKSFQGRYQSVVLDPWGISEPTGYVYYTTQKHVNELYCDGTSEFPLNDEQQSEIDSFKTGVEAAEEAGDPIPDTSNIGFEDETTPTLAVLAEEIIEEEETESIEDEGAVMETPAPLVRPAQAFTASAFEAVQRATLFDQFVRRLQEALVIPASVYLGEDISFNY